MAQVPDLSIFLDVDDLKDGKGAELVACSRSVLVFCSRGYFQSANCLRELLTAVFAGSDIITLLDPEEDRGGLSRDQVT